MSFAALARGTRYNTPMPTSAPLPAPSREDWQQVFTLLDTALELDPAARADWLSTLGADQQQLAPLLTRLLHEHAEVADSDFLQASPIRALSSGPAPFLVGPDALVGPYRLLREIGQGGMANVWLAERADGLLERRVALKLPHASWGNTSLADTARERSILASLTHPNIARLYDVGLASDGRPFLALEYVDGQPIDTYAATHGLGVR